MQKLFWLGSPFFSKALGDCGWEVSACNFNDIRVYTWDRIVKEAGFEPDVVVVADKSRPPFVAGMETFPCVTVFYAVDTHIHSWYPFYGQAFDVCLVSLKDDIPQFLNKRLPESRVWWSPPYARDDDLPNPSVIPVWDLLFVGTVSDIMPRRKAFLEQVGQLVPGLHVTQGNYRELYPKGQIILNHCEHGDLNFRVFEAMGCGRCLLTPRVGHDLVHMFVDGEHTVMYEPDNAKEVAEKTEFLLEDVELVEYIGEQAKLLIDEKHRASHRAQTFTDRMCDIWMEDPDALVQDRLAHADDIREQYLRMLYLHLAEQMPYPELQAAYLAAANGRYTG